MRNTLIIFSLWIGFISFSQKETYSGNYENKTESKSGIVVEYELELNSNRTFLFHFYQDQICYSDEYKIKGQWIIENDTITFLVNKEIDDNHTIDFDQTKAKIENKVLTFHNCGTFWINEKELTKK
jgi:hypothetical protein